MASSDILLKSYQKIGNSNGEPTNLEQQDTFDEAINAPFPTPDQMNENAVSDSDVTLVHVKHETLPIKDFGSEIRASLDSNLLNKAVFLLDVHETTLEDILDRILKAMEVNDSAEFTSEQVRSGLFTDVGILSGTVQSICSTGTEGGAMDYDQTWTCALCVLPSVKQRHVAIARLKHPTNLGSTMEELKYLIIIIAPTREKGTKTALETSRTFATLFADMDVRQKLGVAHDAEQFRVTLINAAKEMNVSQEQRKKNQIMQSCVEQDTVAKPTRWCPGRGVLENVKRRSRFYASDFLDGIRGPGTIHKLLSTTAFLYFACLLPSIAFGVLNDNNTNGRMTVRKTIMAQAIGGLLFGTLGGQPMTIMLTTAPIAIYIKIIYELAESFHVDFMVLYAWVGLWCQLFLFIAGITELSFVMKWVTRSAKEIFSLFIAAAFVTSANITIQKPSTVSCNTTSGSDSHNETVLDADQVCNRASSILFLFLMLGTLWLGLFLYNFRKTPFLNHGRREMLADYAMPVAVVVISFIGSYLFRAITMEKLNYTGGSLGTIPALSSLPVPSIPISLGLGFCLSVLIFTAQNISSAIVNNEKNKLRKGGADHLDLVVVAILNSILSVYGLPWLHGALLHSPLHVRRLADMEERETRGHVHEVITNVRETRLATLIAHALIGLSGLFLLPVPLDFIPTGVLYGIFIYLAVTSLNGNEMFERFMLLVTEQAAYPPTHYIRRVPQRKMHLFTIFQTVTWALVCAFGFFPQPYVSMFFPLVWCCFLPLRHLVIPRIISSKYLDALDGRNIPA